MDHEISKILVVDDEETIASLIREHLQMEGFNVSLASNGREACKMIRAANEEGAPFHLVITDVNMPYMDGVGLLRWVKKNHPSMSVLVMTGGGINRAILDNVRIGLDEYCQKPFAPELLHGMILVMGKRRAAWLRPDFRAYGAACEKRFQSPVQ